MSNQTTAHGQTPSLFDTSPRFNGPVYDPALDHGRLRRQIGRVFDLLLDGRWRSLQEIANAIRYTRIFAWHVRGDQSEVTKGLASKAQEATWMALFCITNEKLEAVPCTSFIDEKILERRDLQRLLKADITPLGDDLMVLAEEFGNWEESSRRIDLLCLDKQARLVVVEIKRSEDGGHMELQAIRYAEMVSSMTLEQAMSAHARMLTGDDTEARSRKEILEFLELDSTEEVELTEDVRIILVSGDFSSELATSVIWLNKHALDVTCIRLKPYKVGDRIVLDVTQLIPLPEAANYEVKVRAQAQETRKVRSARQEIFGRFWAQLIDRSRSRTQLFANRSTTTDHWLSAGIGRAGFGLNLSLTEERARVECYIRMGKDSDDRNKAAFSALMLQREQIEATFGEQLDWQDLPDRIGCRICKDFEGGWRTPETEWVSLQDRLVETAISLEKALKNPIQNLTT
jgi:hypothetical protein